MRWRLPLVTPRHHGLRLGHGQQALHQPRRRARIGHSATTWAMTWPTAGVQLSPTPLAVGKAINDQSRPLFRALWRDWWPEWNPLRQLRCGPDPARPPITWQWDISYGTGIEPPHELHGARLQLVGVAQPLKPSQKTLEGLAGDVRFLVDSGFRNGVV